MGLCLESINQIGSEPRLPGITVGHLDFWRFFLSQAVDTMIFSFSIVNHRSVRQVTLIGLANIPMG